MKFFIWFLIVINPLAHSSFIPERTVTPLLNLYSSQNKTIDERTMEIQFLKNNRRGDVNYSSDRFRMNIDHYKSAREQADAVYKMVPDNRPSFIDESVFHVGTAFHIGENLVLTNHHVLSPDRRNSTECYDFEIYDSETNDKYSCKKVHYCDEEHDVCLIEMAPAKRCHNFLCSNKSFIELKDGPSLSLHSSPLVPYEKMNDIVMSCIGNTMGLGIHYSQGKGLKRAKDKLLFFAPLRSGNSGGPLIGEDGLVWGVVKMESALKVGEEAYNIAAPSELVIKLIRENLVNDAETLEKFNKSVVVK